MSAISPSTHSTPSSKSTKELSAHNLNVKNNKIEPKDGLTNTSTRKNSVGTSSSIVLTDSPAPLTPKENSTNQQQFSGNSISNNLSQSADSTSKSNVIAPSSPSQNKNKITEFPHFKVGVSEDRNRRCRRTMEVNEVLR